MARRFASDTFALEYKQTIGLDFFSKTVILPDRTEISLQIWDIGGQSIGSKMIQNYLFGAHAIIFVYDVTNYDSFQDLEDWMRLVRRSYPESERMPHLIVVGNKMDLVHLRCVNHEQHLRFATENAVGFAGLASAKSGNEVHSLFFSLAAKLAGQTLLRYQIEQSTKSVKAVIVNHQQNDPAFAESKIPEPKKPRCVVS